MLIILNTPLKAVTKQKNRLISMVKFISIFKLFLKLTKELISSDESCVKSFVKIDKVPIVKTSKIDARIINARHSRYISFVLLPRKLIKSII